LRRQELERQAKRDEKKRRRQVSLAGQTQYFGNALKYSLPKMPDDLNEIPAYFSAVEKIFRRYEVPKQIQLQLLIPKLNDKSKSLLVKLSSEKQNDY